MTRTLIVAILLVVLLLTLAWWWWSDRRLRRLEGRWTRRLTRAALSMSALVILTSFACVMGERVNVYLFGGLPQNQTPSWMQYVAMLWTIFAAPLVIAPTLCLAAIVASTRCLTRRTRGESNCVEDDAISKESTRVDLTRRRLLTVSTAAAITAPPMVVVAASAIGAVQNRRFDVIRRDVGIPHLPPALHGLRIVHLSDVHVGSMTHGNIINNIVEAVNELDADLVAFTGDLVNYDMSDLDVGIDMLRRLRSRYGTFIVEGNHDLIHGPDAFAEPIRKAELNLVRRRIDRLTIEGQPVELLGLPYTHNPWWELGQLQRYRRSGAFALSLAHHPHAFDHAPEYKIPLTLVGHTHGGQLMLGGEFGVGPTLFRYWSGMYAEGPSRLHVSNGVGTWFPLRIGAPARLDELTLRPVE